MIGRVVGTTYSNLPNVEKFIGTTVEVDNTLVYKGIAVLKKEHDNIYDKNAVAVYGFANINDTMKPIQIGYLGKTSEMYKVMNNSIHEEIKAKLKITEYLNGYNSKYEVACEF